MAESIIDGTGGGYPVGVTSENRMKVDLGGDIIISGVSIDSVTIQETGPLDDVKNNPAFLFEYQVSGTAGGTIGSRIGSVTMFIDTGSFVNVLTYANNRITNIGSWS
tara:strand:- start:453 stop:773 length:321 start_codon:yes stop_codon:yes gene_type:complete